MSKLLNVQNNILKSGRHYLTSDYKTRNGNRSTHNGMDFVGPNGIDDIVALASGTVAYIRYDSRSGHWIGIKSDNYEHRYFHLDGNKIYVKVGSKVNKGDVIATMGKSGNATNYNVHFAIYKNGYVDPLPYLMASDSNAFETFVKDLQAAIGANVDGIPGPETLAKTITINTSTNWNHKAVKVLQTYLASLGYDLGKYGIDGKFGPDMKKVIKEYQKNIVGLTGNYVDGSLTAHMYTWKKLLKLS